MSHRNPLEALEPRTHFDVALPTPPPTDFGIFGVGHTLFVNGNAARDLIRIIKAPATGSGATADQHLGEIQVQINNTNLSFQPGNFKKFIIHGMAGDDTIRIDPGLPATFHPRTLIIHGDAGNDTITGSDRNDRIFGGDGNDVIIGFTGADEIRGGAGDDRVDGGSGNDRLFGDDGNDILTGGPGADRMFGGAGDDIFHNNETEAQRQQAAFRDLLDGGGGNDTAETAPADRYRLLIGRI